MDHAVEHELVTEATLKCTLRTYIKEGRKEINAKGRDNSCNKSTNRGLEESQEDLSNCIAFQPIWNTLQIYLY